ncbi:hypothetical protein EDB87DRAFT_944056 [Lactarius vividus]|nr:hypothetical protein EDB87DRAFT_944056 [Lactarius vividus]
MLCIFLACSLDLPGRFTILLIVCLVPQLKSLHTIQNLTATDRGHHLILAVILILKHATFLCLSNLSSRLALAHAELEYRAASIDAKIQRYLMASFQEHSVELFAAFIMATDILPSNSSATDITPPSSPVKTKTLKNHWFERFWRSVYPVKNRVVKPCIMCATHSVSVHCFSRPTFIIMIRAA